MHGGFVAVTLTISHFAIGSMTVRGVRRGDMRGNYGVSIAL
jgi:hypothetical protein